MSNDWGGAASGAAGGAMTGATIGSVIPGVGNLVGAGVGALAGGLAGFFGGSNSEAERRRREALAAENARMQGGDMLRGYAQGQMNGAQGRQGLTMQGSQLNGADQYQSRAGQQALAGQLNRVATGQEAGAGELAVNRQAHAAAANQFASQGMARGSNAATAARAAAGQLGNIGTNASGMAAQSALSDQQAARGQLAGVYDSMRGSDLSYAGQNAQLAQQAAMQNQNAGMQQRQMNDAYANNMFGNYANVSQAELNARMQRAGMLANQPQQNMGANLLQMGGTMGAAYFNSRGGGGGGG